MNIRAHPSPAAALPLTGSGKLRIEKEKCRVLKTVRPVGTATQISTVRQHQATPNGTLPTGKTTTYHLVLSMSAASATPEGGIATEGGTAAQISIIKQ
jgi:hypothetical protein